MDRWGPQGRGPLRAGSRGVTLLELMLALAVAAVLAAIAIPSYRNVTERLKVDAAGKDLMLIAQQIERYRLAHDFHYPNDLGQLSGIPTRDPWGNAYRYLNFDDATGVGNIRKDRNLHPLNSQFDLYSVGKDGQSLSALTAPVSQDDVIWARDGGYIGLAADF